MAFVGPSDSHRVKGWQRAGAVKRTRPSDAGLVVPGARVDPDRVAGLDEDRDLDDETRLGRGWLARTRLGIAREPGLRVGNDEVDGHRELDADRLALVARPV